MTDPQTPATEAGRRMKSHLIGMQVPDGDGPWRYLWKDILAIEAEARAALDPLIRAALLFYADQMPAYAVAAGLTRDEYAAVMVDVRKARAVLAETER